MQKTTVLYLKPFIRLIILQVFFTFVFYPAINVEAKFKDVSSANVFHSFIQNLSNDGVIGGYGDGTFRPARNVTRAELAKFVVKSFNIPIKTDCDNFADFNSGSDLVKYVTTLKCNGIVGGTKNGFLPSQYVTRGESMIFIIRAANLMSPGTYYNTFYANYFGDVPTDSNFYEYVMSGVSHGIVSGTKNGFEISRNVTRGEISKIVDIARRVKSNLQYYTTTSKPGAKVYYVGNHIVQTINLDEGARLEIRHGSISTPNNNAGVYGNSNPSFYSRDIETFWNVYSKEANNFSVYNSAFFRANKNPTEVAFAIKKDGQILTDGYAGTSEFKNQKKVLQIWNDQNKFDITDFDENLPSSQIYDQITAPDGIVSLSPDANKSKNAEVGRTFMGIKDSDGDGDFETAIIFVSRQSSQDFAKLILSEFGAQKMIMFDGGGSSQVKHLDIDTNRPIPIVLVSFHG